MNELPDGTTSAGSPKKKIAKRKTTSRHESPLSCTALQLRPSLERTADNVASVAHHLATNNGDTLLSKIWRSVKTAALYISVIVGSLFALEQYLASNHWEVNDRVQTQLLSASAALGDDDHIVKANAIRSLARITEFKTYEVSQGVASIGQHIRAGFFGHPDFFPYFEDSWLVLRDFATSRDSPNSELVSTEVLREGAWLEHRTRDGGNAPAQWNRGSLLFQARLPRAMGNDLDLSGIQFGAANLEGSTLTGSDCSQCGMLGVRLEGSILRGTVLASAYLSESNVDNADLSFADARNAVFNKASLKNSRFLQANLTQAQFRYADLTGAIFSQTNLSGTDFSNANLHESNFDQSDVSGAKFSGANVEGTDFARANNFDAALLTDAINADKAILPTP